MLVGLDDGLELIQFSLVETVEMLRGEVPDQQIQLFGTAMPATVKQPLAANFKTFRHAPRLIDALHIT